VSFEMAMRTSSPALVGRCKKNELNYCVTRKELLAIVHFAKHFRQYLLGRQFVIRTDHAARRFGLVAADTGADRTERKVVGAAWRVLLRGATLLDPRSIELTP